MKNSGKTLALIGLVLGAVLGMAGTMVAAQNVRAVLWAIDSTGLIVATALMALMRFRSGDDVIAAGFLVYAVGEAVMLSGTAMSLEASVPAFAAGTALWAAALLLTSVPKGFPIWGRVAGCVAAGLFGMVSLRDFMGQVVTPLDKPLPFFAYPFLVLTFVGWGRGLMKGE